MQYSPTRRSLGVYQQVHLMTSTPHSVEYRRVRRSIRPARVATLVPNDEHWRSDVLRILEGYSRTWGGDGNALIGCSDSWEVHEAFWSLLKSVDPDHWTVFQRTLRGLKMSDPTFYDRWLDEQVKAWVGQHGGTEDAARQMFDNEHSLSRPLGSWPPPQELSSRIRHWYSPLAQSQTVIHGAYRVDEPPSHNLVDMCQLTFRPEAVSILDMSRLPLSIQLLVVGRTGSLSPSHRAKLQSDGKTTEVEISVEEEDLPLLLEYAWTGRVDMGHLRLAQLVVDESGLQGPHFSSDSFLRSTPFVLSRLGCNWFTRWRPGVDDEPLVVVCGDTANDYCYAFTRGRVVGNTYWLPLGSDSHDEHAATLRETLARVLVESGSGPSGDRSIHFTSLSMDGDEVSALLEEVRATPWGGQLSSAIGPSGLDTTVRGSASLSHERNLVLLDEAHFDDTLSEPIMGGEFARTAEIPLPSKAAGILATGCRWQVDFDVEGHSLPARSEPPRDHYQPG